MWAKKARKVIRRYPKLAVELLMPRTIKALKIYFTSRPVLISAILPKIAMYDSVCSHF